jgi:hypothetical protein
MLDVEGVMLKRDSSRRKGNEGREGRNEREVEARRLVSRALGRRWFG